MTDDFNLDDLPPDVLSQITQGAIQRGFLPPPDGYDAEGQPVWNLEKMGAFYGHSPAEAKAILERYQLEHPDRTGYVDPSGVHRIQ